MDKDTSKKENYRHISSMNIDAKIDGKPNPTTHQKDQVTMIKSASSQGCRDGSIYANQ
jgi:hypothetical protein